MLSSDSQNTLERLRLPVVCKRVQIGRVTLMKCERRPSQVVPNKHDVAPKNRYPYVKNAIHAKVTFALNMLPGPI